MKKMRVEINRECVDGDPIWDAVRSIATAYKLANARPYEALLES